MQLARPWIIPGTNRFARVCQRWREASNDSEDVFQLLVDLPYMSEASISKASAWLSMYGQQVDVLVLLARPLSLPEQAASMQKLQWFPAAAPAMSHLTWLEVHSLDSLMMLAPVLGQLPQLKQLAAQVTMSRYCPGKEEHAEVGEQAEVEDEGGKGGVFVDTERNVWKEVPDLTQVCPRLVNLHLHLTVDPGRHLLVDHRLARLLPVHLQQLVLTGARNTAVRVSSLAHLSAVQQLTLRGVAVKGSAGRLAQQLEALQQFRVTGPYAHHGHDSFVVHLAPKVTEYGLFAHCGVGVLVQLSCLTRLTLGSVNESTEGTADAVGQLTGLQELALLGCATPGVARVLQQAAGMSSLRHLELGVISRGRRYAAVMAASLGQCTQLTSVQLLDTPPECVRALQQLSGLRGLTVQASLLLAQGGTWLAPLTNLSRLVAYVMTKDDRTAVFPATLNYEPWAVHQNAAVSLSFDGLLNKVCAWPASLQTVVFLVDALSWTPYFTPMSFVRHPPGYTGAGITVWLEWWDHSAKGWARPFRQAPHLPGLWELQGPAERTFEVWY
jgi:hypothetical protein